MPDSTIAVATRFVDLVLKYKQWDEVVFLSEEEIQVFFDVVSAAGFCPSSLVPGKVKVWNRDTKKEYYINKLCPLMVVCKEESGNNHLATGWLNDALRCVVNGVGRTGREESREQCIKIIAAEIERSVPLTPIQLTPEGDMLCEDLPTINWGNYFVEHTKDSRDLGSSGVGVHQYCNGYIDRKRATKTHDAIVCRACFLRVLFPKEVKTYGELRQALVQKKVQTPA
jgi:hypothetical protein